MEQEYFAIITDIGANKLLRQELDLTHFAVGEAPEAYKPTSDMTQLKNEKWRGIVTRVATPNGAPNELIIETYIPATIGGFGVNEMAAFDVDGDMIAIAITPIISKPTPESGSGIDLTPKIRLVLASTENFIIKVDSTDKDYVDFALGEHNTDPLAHPYTNPDMPDVKSVAEAIDLISSSKANVGSPKVYTLILQPDYKKGIYACQYQKADDGLVILQFLIRTKDDLPFTTGIHHVVLLPLGTHGGNILSSAIISYDASLGAKNYSGDSCMMYVGPNIQFHVPKTGIYEISGTLAYYAIN